MVCLKTLKLPRLVSDKKDFLSFYLEYISSFSATTTEGKCLFKDDLFKKIYIILETTTTTPTTSEWKEQKITNQFAEKN